MSAPRALTANFQLLTTTTVAAVSGENGAQVNLSATVGPAGAVFSGTLQFQVQGANVGSPVPVSGAGIYTLPYTITQTAGSYPVSAILSSTTPNAGGSSGSSTLAVTLKVQGITFNAIPPQVVGAAVALGPLASASSGLPVSFVFADHQRMYRVGDDSHDDRCRHVYNSGLAGREWRVRGSSRRSLEVP